MRRSLVSIGLCLAALPACNGEGLGASSSESIVDLSVALQFPDAPLPPPADPCVDDPSDPGQHTVAYGPPAAPFPLQTAPLPTEWGNLTWDADVPAMTALVVQARSGASSSRADPSWSKGVFTDGTSPSPVCLQTALTPNVTPQEPFDVGDGWLLVEFVFKTGSRTCRRS